MLEDKAQTKNLQARMVQQMCYQCPCALIADLAAVQAQNAEVVGILHCLCQQLAVHFGEVKEVPFKVHATIVDPAQMYNKD